MKYNFIQQDSHYRCTHNEYPVLQIGDSVVINSNPHVVDSIEYNEFVCVTFQSGKYKRLVWFPNKPEPRYEVNGMNSVEMLEVPRLNYCMERYLTVYGKDSDGKVIVKQKGWFSE